MDNLNEARQIIRVTRVGLWLNLWLFALKLSVGILVASAALIADAVHTISDILSDFVVLLGIRLSSRPADTGHDYGHGKYETIAASAIAILLVGAGFYITFKASLDIHQGEVSEPSYAVLAVAAVAIAAKEWIFRVTRRIGKQIKSPVLRVNAWHHRSDAFSSIAVLFGAIAGISGWGHGDHAAAIAVGIMIIAVGLKAAWKYITELSEGSVSHDERNSIAEAIRGVAGVRSWHKLRTRLVGREIFMDVHVIVDSHLSVDQGHEICSAVEKAIAKSVKRSTNIVVHCEPDRDSGQ